MTCILHAYGTNFQARQFLAEASMPPSQLLRKGEEPLFNGTYIIVRVSDAENLLNQIEDAITFLKAYQNNLKKLRDCPGVEEVCLNFSIRIEEPSPQNLDFPPLLHQLACQNGINLNIFEQETACPISGHS